MHKKEFIVEVNSADDGDIPIWKAPKDLFPPIPVKKELIRCKECKFYESSVALDRQGYCWYQNTRGFFRNDDDFCSRAERV